MHTHEHTQTTTHDRDMYVCIFKKTKCRIAHVIEIYGTVMLLHRLLKMSLLPKNITS